MSRLFKLCCGSLLLLSTSAFAACLSDQGPYEDNYGYAVFPFKNLCGYSVQVSLCVKSYPDGVNATYNLYGRTISAESTESITDGLWRTYDSYQWAEDSTVSCPFD